LAHNPKEKEKEKPHPAGALQHILREVRTMGAIARQPWRERESLGD